MSIFSRIDPSVIARLPHGRRARYVSGCRCEECRRANTLYETQRNRARARGDWNGLVDATRGRRHLLRLSRAGVGRRTVCDIAGISRTVYSAIRSGRKLKIRARTARRILTVTRAAMHDAKLLPAAPTLSRIRRLLEEGFTRGEIARRLGSRARIPALQIGRRPRVTARTAMRVQKLWRSIMEM